LLEHEHDQTQFETCRGEDLFHGNRLPRQGVQHILGSSDWSRTLLGCDSSTFWFTTQSEQDIINIANRTTAIEQELIRSR
jgi:hypothetical protein